MTSGILLLLAWANSHISVDGNVRILSLWWTLNACLHWGKNWVHGKPWRSNGGKSIRGTRTLKKQRKSQQDSRNTEKIKGGSEGQYRTEISKKGVKYVRFAIQDLYMPSISTFLGHFKENSFQSKWLRGVKTVKWITVEWVVRGGVLLSGICQKEGCKGLDSKL